MSDQIKKPVWLGSFWFAIASLFLIGVACFISATTAGLFYVKEYPLGSFQRIPIQGYEVYLYVTQSKAAYFLGSNVTGDLVIIKPEGATLVGASRNSNGGTLDVELTWSYANGNEESWPLEIYCLDKTRHFCISKSNLFIDKIIVCNLPLETCIQK
jgi:hypothetical protein